MFLMHLKARREEARLLKQQGCVVYCPKCRNELISSGSFVEDNDGIVKYECTICGTISFWDFIHYPIPYLRTCYECVHLAYNSDGSGECCIPKQCNPDMMVKYETRKVCDE